MTVFNKIIQKQFRNELKQIKKPYQSTLDFFQFVKRYNGFKPNTSVLDAGSGMGNNTFFFANKEKSIKFICGDNSKKHLSLGKKIFKKIPNLSFEHFDILKENKKLKNKFDGIISIHAMHCFKELENPIKNLCNLKPKWICIKTLAYRGNMDVLIHIRDYDDKIKDDNPIGDFNIFSEKKIINIFRKHNYKTFIQEYFPKKKIGKKNVKNRGSYTIKTEFNKNSTFSGPVYLPWKFIFAERK